MRRLLCLFAALSVIAGQPASSHPHVFVETRAGFMFDPEGRLASLRITWTYDAFTSLVLFDILDLDKDRDGKLDEEDRAAVVAGETSWGEGYNGDIFVELGEATVPMAAPTNGSAWMTEDRITVAFDLPLAEPLDTDGALLLRFYDPAYYYAYEVVALEDGVRNGCTAEIIPFEPDAATAELQRQLAALSREETPEQADVGSLFADQVWLRCG